MTDLLIKLFIKDKENVQDSTVRGKYAMLSSSTGIIVNIMLSIGKLIIGIISNSMSIISDAVNNMTDAGSSVVTLVGFKMSQKQEDDDHPWGHGRMEYVAAFIVDILIVLVGVELFQSSIEKIINPVFPAINNITIALLVVAIIAKLWLFLFYKKIAKIIDSNAVKATAYDSISDTVSTSVVLFSSIFAMVTGITIDGYVSLLVAIFILFTGFKAIKETIDLLLGTKPDKEFIDEIHKFTENYDELIIGIHDIMVHDYGPGRKIISFHAEVPQNVDICKAHDVIDRMEEEMYKEFNCITTIHMDPMVVDNEEIDKMKEMVEKIITDINPEFSIHDFRMTDGGERVNLVFDLVIPSSKNSEREEIEKQVKTKIKAINPKYYAVMKVENAYV